MDPPADPPACQLPLGDGTVQRITFSQVYDQLRGIAGSYMARERHDHTLDPTDLVGEACLRLSPDIELEAATQHRLVGYVAHVMRQVLVDHARQAKAQKRGRGWQRVTLGGLTPGSGERHELPLEALADALEWLAAEDPELCGITESYYLGGLTAQQIAARRNVSRATVHRELKLARALLLAEIDRREAGLP